MTDKYVTMTPMGSYGSEFVADSWAEAANKAEEAGYIVVDMTEHGGQNILVVEG